mmetsp:Transcript_15924/g.22147  ORF Transcript_15924/g.22147 Transcript_15924/m.22147 type:complete len:257 (+) Transcript_15924:117-887(+)
MPLWARDNHDNDNLYGSTTASSKNKQIDGDGDNNTSKNKDGTDDTTEQPPSKPIILRVFNLFETFGVITCLRLLAMQLAPLFFTPLDQFSWLQIWLRCYVSLCCLLFALVEIEVKLPFIQDNNILQSWIGKGFLYLFIGLVGLEERYIVLVEDIQQQEKAHIRSKHAYDEIHVDSWAALAIAGASFFMVILACLYVLLGMCCMRKWRDTMRQEYANALGEYYEIHGKPNDGRGSKIKVWCQSVWKPIQDKLDDIEI